MESGMYGQERRREFIYIVPFFITVNIECFLLGCGMTKFLFLRGPLPESDMLEITPSAQVRALRDTSRGSVLCVIIPGSSPNTLSEKLTSSGGREDASQSIIFYIFHML